MKFIILWIKYTEILYKDFFMNILRITFITILLGLFFNGCATWEGIKTDTSNGWNATKEAIHDATAE